VSQQSGGMRNGDLAERQLSRSVGWRSGGPAGQRSGGQQPSCSFSKLWGGETFHELGVQGAEVWLSLS
jgi:hypothetical protein